jgi:hypothetical protein
MSEERRAGGRVITDFPLVLMDEADKMLDLNATAHDLSESGFRVETQAGIAPGQVVHYRIVAFGGRELRGSAKVAWAQRTDLALWAGAEFLDLSWADKRMLKRATSPPSADWVLIATKLLLAVIWIGGALALWVGLRSPFWRPQLSELFPKIVAAVLFGWSLRELLTPDR